MIHIQHLFDTAKQILYKANFTHILTLQDSQFIGEVIGIHITVAGDKQTLAILNHQGQIATPFVLYPHSIEVFRLAADDNHYLKVDTVTLRQADFDRQIFELQEEKRKLYESLVSGGIPLPKYKEQKEQISERLLEVQNTKAVVMARLEAEQEERQHQRQQMDISRMLTESDGLTSELVDLLIDKIYVYPDKRVDIAFKIRDSFTTHD